MRGSLELEARKMNKSDEIYEKQCEQEFVHREQPNEDYFEGLNDYLDGTEGR